MAAQYAYVMKGMTKSFPGAQKPVLSNISLQFYQGAKIGIVGPNGAGKSTLIKIMAGIDTDYTGEAWAGENITVGYLEQEPELDNSKTVLENVKDGARGIADMVDRFNEISALMCEPAMTNIGMVLPDPGFMQKCRELTLKYGSLLVIDDIHALDEAGQRALFQLYNAARYLGLALLLSGTARPLQLHLREDLRTRIGQMLIYEVQQLSDEEKAAALMQHAQLRGMAMDPAVVQYVLRHGRRDLSSLMHTLDSLDRISLEQHRALTVPLVREIMQTTSA